MHFPVRGEEKRGEEEEERPVLGLGMCQASWHRAHITPLFHVQAVQDTARSQTVSNIYFAENICC